MKKFLLCWYIASVIAVMQMITTTVSSQNMIDVDYIVEYPDDTCSTSPNPSAAAVSVPAQSVALIVMQEAANDNSELRFTATYFGTELGYFIDTLNGTTSDSSSNCFWFIYIRDPDGNETLSPLGVSNYVLPGTGYSIIWRYEEFVLSNSTHSNDSEPAVDLPTVMEPITTITVDYEIQYNDPDCADGFVAPPMVEVTIPTDGSAQQVLEGAVDVGPQYRFTATFFNNELGYFVNAINGTRGSTQTNCFWLFYIRLPDGEIVQPDVGVSNYVIPANDYGVIMRYEDTEHEESTDATDGVACLQRMSGVLFFFILLTAVILH